MSWTLLKVASVFIAVIVSATKPVVALWAEMAFIAAKLSEQIAMEQLFLSNNGGMYCNDQTVHGFGTE